MTHIAVLKGDGIGPEIIDAALRVLQKTAEIRNLGLTFEEGAFGGIAIDQHGTPYPEETKALLSRSDAILLGAVGGPKWDNVPRENRPETGLLAIRKEMGLFCNIRPVVYRDFLADRLVFKKEVVENVDFVICRELTGGIYFGEKKREGDYAYDVMAYSKPEIERIVMEAFKIANARPRRHLTSVDKANVLETSRLWREVVEEVAEDFPEVTYDHLYVDNAAVQLVLNPSQFDVIVTENSFGDILSDEAGALAGSLGMLPSASLGGRVSLFEPSHGSAPELAGTGKANPVAAILSAAMLLRFTVGDEEGARLIERATEKALEADYKTPDIAGENSTIVSTLEMAEKIISFL